VRNAFRYADLTENFSFASRRSGLPKKPARWGEEIPESAPPILFSGREKTTTSSAPATISIALGGFPTLACATLGARPTDSLRRRSTVALPSGESAWRAATSAKAVAIASWIGLRKGADGSNHLPVSNAIDGGLENKPESTK